MSSASDFVGPIRSFVLEQFLSGGDPSELTSSTPLYDAGVLDSIATLRLVEFLEDEFSVSFEAHEVDPENFRTVEHIAELMASKVSR